MLEFRFYQIVTLIWDLCFEKKYNGSATSVLMALAQETELSSSPVVNHQVLIDRIMSGVEDKADCHIRTPDHLCSVLRTYREIDLKEGERLKPSIFMDLLTETELGATRVLVGLNSTHFTFSLRAPEEPPKILPYFEIVLKGPDEMAMATQPMKFEPLRGAVHEVLTALAPLLFPEQQKTLQAWLPSLKP
jgi:hypothetical protein